MTRLDLISTICSQSEWRYNVHCSSEQVLESVDLVTSVGCGGGE